MKNAMRAAGLVVLCLCVLSTTTVAAADSLADSIPADVFAAVVIDDAAQLESDVGLLAQSIGVPLPRTFSFEAVRAMLGVGDDWQADRGFAVAVMEPSRDGVVVLLPVSDAEATLAHLGAEAEGDLYRFTLGTTTFSAMVKERLLFIGSEDGAAAVRACHKAARTLADDEAHAALLADSDLFYFVNAPKFRPLVDNATEMMLTGMREGMKQLENAPDNPQIPKMPMAPTQIMAILKWEIEGFLSLIRQTNSLYGGVSVDAKGVTARESIRFQEGSYLASIAAKKPGPPLDLLHDLPQRPFVAAFGIDTRALGQLLVDMSRSMLELPEFSARLDDEKLKQAIANMTENYEKLQGSGFLFDLTPDGIVIVGLYFYDDPHEAQKRAADEMIASQELMAGMMPFRFEVEATKKQIDGIEVDEYRIDFGEAMGPLRSMMEAIYGKNLRVQVGVVGDDLGFAMGSQEDAIKLLNTGGNSLTAQQRVRDTLKDLPDSPVAVVLIDLSGALQAGLNIAQRMAGAMGIPAPPKLEAIESTAPPVGLAITTTKNGFTGHWNVPADSIRQVVQAAMRLKEAASQPAGEL